MVNELDEYKGNTDAIHGQKSRELRMKVSELEHRIEQLQEEERFRMEEVMLSHEEVVTQLKVEIERTQGSAHAPSDASTATNIDGPLAQQSQGDAQAPRHTEVTKPLAQQLQEAWLEIQTLKQISELKQQSLEQEISDLRKQLDAERSTPVAESDKATGPVGRGRGKKQQRQGAGAKPSKSSTSVPDVDKRVEQLQKQLEVAQAELQILKSTDDKPAGKGKKNAKASAKLNKPDEVTNLRKQLEGAKAEIAALKKKTPPSNKTGAKQGNAERKDESGEVEKLRREITDLKQQLADSTSRVLLTESSSETQDCESSRLQQSQAAGLTSQPKGKSRKDGRQSTGRGPPQPTPDSRKEVTELKKQLEKTQAELRSLRGSEAGGKGKKAGKHNKGQKAGPSDDLQQRLDKANAEIGGLKEAAAIAVSDKASLESEAATLRDGLKGFDCTAGAVPAV